MARSNILVRLSGRKHERRTSETNGDVKQMTQDTSWHRRSLASLSRWLSPGLRPVPSPPKPDPDVLNTQVLDNKTLTSNGTKFPTPYSKPVELIRQQEYPHMNEGTYLDHSGATIPALSTLHRTTTLLTKNLYGNPHSTNTPAARSGAAVDAVRLKTLAFLGADPAHYDLVFTTNATAAIKLVGEAFRDLGELSSITTSSCGKGGKGGGKGGFWYGYHREAHTSLVGVRELTGGGGSYCFDGDGEVEGWLSNSSSLGVLPAGEGRRSSLGLVAWPGQSNLTGRRLPGREWAGRVRSGVRDTYSLFDAAALAMTGDMAGVFADPEAAPDFVCVSFYKIFGFPDLGGLVVRRESGHILALRKYFGGGTVSMVSTIGGAWHTSKGLEAGAGGAAGEGHGGALHEGLEDGTLPFHSILALGEAIDVHAELYGSMENISAHTTALVTRMYLGMRGLRYGNGQPLCKIYEDESGGAYGDAKRQGATVAFNLFRADGGYESYATVERLANDRGVYVRSGGICCPGGLFAALQYEQWQLHRARSAGHHCGPDGIGVINELPTGVVRASLGAMSTIQDVDRFLSFLYETFIARQDSAYASINGNDSVASHQLEHPGAVPAEKHECVPQLAACC
ncbi:pyridoxal phosphate-dependent transferase [Parachaetomium inaequale]|uniref:Pyridoxal phosphate-dependent transferase n=1 Tax=Parachaetomium inaequale TaxID=2588326 RepID=A0AAN6PMU2_9PEZI|nr:pyridoxal phosphate-dependent transferase [Parachaetomium inaequale]